MIAFLAKLFGGIGAKLWGYAAIAGGVVAAILAMRGDAKRDARREAKAKSTEDALKRERKRNEIDRNIDPSHALDKLHRDWSE